jgi:hypothetical protein
MWWSFFVFFFDFFSIKIKIFIQKKEAVFKKTASNTFFKLLIICLQISAQQFERLYLRYQRHNSFQIKFYLNLRKLQQILFL